MDVEVLLSGCLVIRVVTGLFQKNLTLKFL